MAERYRPGERAPRSGVYEIVGPDGGRTGEVRTVAKGRPLPPTPKSGRRYELVEPIREGRSSAKTRQSIAATERRFAEALKNLAKR